MKKALVIVNASDPGRTSAALAEAVRLHAEEPTELHLLNVQPAVNGHVAMFFGDRELHDLQEAAGVEELAPALALLRERKVPCSSSVRIGRSAETIARTARELGCDRIVLGRENEPAGVVSKVFGSLAHQVRALMQGSGDCRVIGA